jgi:uncharacterized GH25 family protein
MTVTSLRRAAVTIAATAATVRLTRTDAPAQQPISRLQGRVLTERGEPVPHAEVRVEAFHGYAAGTFAGQRTFSTITDAKGDWKIRGLKSGFWLVEVLPRSRR